MLSILDVQYAPTCIDPRPAVRDAAR
jgi:hypothetical protein